MKTQKNAFFRNIGFFILLFVLLVAIIIYPNFFLKQEKFFYFWDYSGYQLTALYQAENLRKSFAEFWYRIIISVGDEYTAIFTLFTSPLMLLFGNVYSRTVYITALTIVFFSPYVLLIGLISQQFEGIQSRYTILLGIFVCVTTPAAWLPTLRGYPDTGAAALIASAILIYLKEHTINKWIRIILIGSLLPIAILFRRHFLYEVIVFYTSMFAVVLVRYLGSIKKQTSEPHRRLLSDSLQVVLTGVVSVFILLTIGSDFYKNIRLIDYSSLYSSYLVSAKVSLHDFQEYYGWGIILIAFLGMVVGFRQRNTLYNGKLFILFYFFFMVTIWSFFVRYINPHYTLHLTTPLLVMVVWFFQYIKQIYPPIVKYLLSVPISIFVAINNVYWIAPAQLNPNINSYKVLSDNNHPLVREDYNEVQNLVNYLHRTADSSSIYVAASSSIINSDLLISADRELYPYTNERLDILKVPEIDSRDFYPIEPLLQADVVIVAIPFQHHLNPAEQDVVQFVYDFFTQDAEASKQFIKLADTFEFEYGTSIMIYKRISNSTISQSLILIDQMQSYIATVPGNQPDWIRLNAFTNAFVEKLSNKRYRLSAIFGDQSHDQLPAFLYIGKISGDYMFHVNRLTHDCGSIIIKVYTTEGKDFDKETDLMQFNKNETTNIDVPFSLYSDHQFLITIENPNIIDDNLCKVELDGVEFIIPSK